MQRIVVAIAAAGMLASAQGAAVAQEAPPTARPSIAAAPGSSSPPLVAYTRHLEPPKVKYINLGTAFGYAFTGGLNDLLAAPGETSGTADMEPANAIAAELATHLALQGAGTVALKPIIVDAQNKNPVARNVETARYIVDADPADMQVMEFMTARGRYSLVFQIWVKLYDSTGRVLARKSCFGISPKEGAPTLEEVTANEGKRLQTMSETQQAICMNKFKTQFKLPKVA